MKTILTCAQPTGTLTLGNYLGAVRNWATLLPGNECYFGIVDQHAITVDYTPSELRQNSLRCVAQYIACGLNPEEAHIFMQSHVTGHNELAWVLSCLTPVGDLLRMIQFKDKTGGVASSKVAEGEGDWLLSAGSGKPQPKPVVNGGILFYPVLMAADVLLYNADIVPVGEDQKQHMELCRDLAQRFHCRSLSGTRAWPAIRANPVGCLGCEGRRALVVRRGRARAGASCGPPLP